MCVTSLVSVIHVDSYDRSIISVLKKNCKGNHHSIVDAFHEKPMDSFIAGHIVKEEMGCKFIKLKKFLLNEVLPDGNIGKVFALLFFEQSCKLSASVNDYLIIHNPKISKNCLINFSRILCNKYEYQVIIGHENKKNCTVDKDTEQFMQVIVPKVKRRNLSEDFMQDGDVDLRNAYKSLESPCTSATSQRIHSLDDTCENSSSSSKEINSPVRKIRRLYNPDANKVVTPKSSYIKLNEISSSYDYVNLFGIIVSVESQQEMELFRNCAHHQQGDNPPERNYKILLRDESTAGGKLFLLNLMSHAVDLPPLNVGYILKAMGVLVQSVDGEITGWVGEGLKMATVDSSLKKPILLFTKGCISQLSDDEKRRIEELRKYSERFLFSGNNPEESETEGRETGMQDIKGSSQHKSKEQEHEMTTEDDSDLTVEFIPTINVHESDSDKSDHPQESDKEPQSETFSEDSLVLHLESSSSDNSIDVEVDENCDRTVQETESGGCENSIPSDDSDIPLKEIWNCIIND